MDVVSVESFVKKSNEKRRAKRRLFDDGDEPDNQGGQETTRLFLDQQWKVILSNACDKWSFDFIHDRPLEGGNFVWTKLYDKTSTETSTLNSEDEYLIDGKRKRQTEITGKRNSEDHFKNLSVL